MNNIAQKGVNFNNRQLNWRKNTKCKDVPE